MKKIKGGSTLSEVATASFLPLGDQATAAIFCMPSTAGATFFQYRSCICWKLFVFEKSNVILICFKKTQGKN